MTLRQTWRERPLWGLLALVCVVGVSTMPAEAYPADPLAMREEARALLLHGELAIEAPVAARFERFGEPGQYIVRNPRDGRSYSKYGSMAAWLAALPLGAEWLVEGELPPLGSRHRVLYLNAFNVILSLLVAASLYRTARRFDAGPVFAASYVALCFYTTFLWNYLRAQNSEIVQLLFFAWCVTGFLDALEEQRNGLRGRAVWRLWAACGALLLTKVSYALIGPLLSLGLVAARCARERTWHGRHAWDEARDHIVPFVLVFGVWATLNALKFGHPLLTGYHAWHPEITGFHGNLFEALRALTVSPQWSLAVCFPLSILALPWGASWLRTKPLAYGTLFGVGLLYTILLAMLPSWTGEWCYGPRYWVFILPFVSLPALGMFAWFQRRARGAWVVGTLVAMMLGGSAWLQWQVNRFPFFAYYALRQPLQGVHTPARDEFFFGRPYGWIVSSMWAARARLDELPWWAEIKSRTSPIQAEQYERRVRSVLGRSNLYFLGVSHPSSVERQSAP